MSRSHASTPGYNPPYPNSGSGNPDLTKYSEGYKYLCNPTKPGSGFGRVRKVQVVQKEPGKSRGHSERVLGQTFCVGRGKVHEARTITLEKQLKA